VSSNSECLVFRTPPGEGGEWFYLLEDSDAPKNSWDWREYATCYGPFSSEAAARDHLDIHQNPGGTTRIRFGEPSPNQRGSLVDGVMTWSHPIAEMDDEMRRHAADAREHRRTGDSWNWR
jgi:hypothetical protein